MTGDVEGSVRVEGDVRELSRVLTNLVLNGIVHTPAHGAVVISAGTDRAAAWVTVTDSCGGIPEPDLSRVFEPWWRGTSARTPSGSSAGLGLAIVRGLVEAHGGSVAVDNVDGGCRFAVRLRRPAARR
ncbi:MAG: sensor histidine kinase [Actinomycetota bacterium]|nr:sensor histidine kinase [Actinomycetota bacterium]